MNNLDVGSVVRLKSGSPNMVVASVTEDRIRCRWFDLAGHAKVAQFEREALEEADDFVVRMPKSYALQSQ